MVKTRTLPSAQSQKPMSCPHEALAGGGVTPTQSGEKPVPNFRLTVPLTLTCHVHHDKARKTNLRESQPTGQEHTLYPSPQYFLSHEQILCFLQNVLPVSFPKQEQAKRHVIYHLLTNNLGVCHLSRVGPGKSRRPRGTAGRWPRGTAGRRPRGTAGSHFTRYHPNL